MSSPTANRTLSLFQASVLNMIDMVGIGPFVMMPVVIGLLGGMYLWAWVAGALLSLVDAMIWSELGAAFPLAGGSFHFLKKTYGENGAGKMMSFLYVWQTIIQAPLVAASAAIGFSQYLIFILPLDQEWQLKLVRGGVIIFITFLLYRKIESIGKIGVLLWAGVLGTMAWIIFGGITKGDFSVPLSTMTEHFNVNILFSFLFGQACVKTIYSYLGYYNVCHLGGDIKDPGRNIPRSMFISVIVIAVLYMMMNISVTSVIPWQEIKFWQDHEVKNFVVSTFIERLYGHTAAIVVTVMILWVALASLFAVMLGYSRVPFAAAREGDFFKFFGRLHPTKNFPHVSLLIMGALAFIFSLQLRMGDVIDAILAMRIIVQFIGQGVGLMLLRKREGTKNFPFKMILYPIPVILAIAMWIFIFSSTGKHIMINFAAVLLSGIIVYMIKANLKKEWPFRKPSADQLIN